MNNNTPNLNSILSCVFFLSVPKCIEWVIKLIKAKSSGKPATCFNQFYKTKIFVMMNSKDSEYSTEVHHRQAQAHTRTHTHNAFTNTKNVGILKFNTMRIKAGNGLKHFINRFSSRVCIT